MSRAAQPQRQNEVVVEVGGRPWRLHLQLEADAGELYWNRLWPASVGLAEFLVQSVGPSALAGKRILELGCGTALVGIVAAQLGAEVVCSDIAPEALRLAERNAEANDVELAGTLQVDWCAPPAMERFDCVVGADVLYFEELVEPLTRTILAAVAPGGRILLSDAIRSPFNALLHHFRQVGLEHRQELLDIQIGKRTHRVGVYEVRPRRARRAQGAG